MQTTFASKAILTIASLVYFAPVHADSAWHINKKIVIKNNAHIGSVEVTYPQLTKKVGGAYRLINKEVLEDASKMRCEPNTGGLPNKDMDYNAEYRVQAITRYFVSYAVSEEISCGGAHPDSGTEAFAYSRKTGKKLDVNAQFGWKAPGAGKKYTSKDYANLETFQKKMATLLAARVPKAAADCLKQALGTTAATMKDELQHWDTTIALKKGGVRIYANPAHVIAACGFDTQVDYKDIKGLIAKKSVLHTWLR